jgi:hypothetical protein
MATRAITAPMAHPWIARRGTDHRRVINLQLPG